MIFSSYEEVAEMVPNVLFGREYEKRKLARCLEMEQAQLVLVYGSISFSTAGLTSS